MFTVVLKVFEELSGISLPRCVYSCLESEELLDIIPFLGCPPFLVPHCDEFLLCCFVHLFSSGEKSGLVSSVALAFNQLRGS